MTLKGSKAGCIFKHFMRKMTQPDSHVPSYFKGVIDISWVRFRTVVNTG